MFEGSSRARKGKITAMDENRARLADY